jgi:hypothetical protein
MPARGHSTAPKFDPTQPRELRRYFNELDLLFGGANITANDIKKKHACRYVDIDTSELWESLPEYGTGSTFSEFREAVHRLYPGSEDDRKWSISDMDKLVGEQLRVGIYDAGDLGLYYRSFYNITQFLRIKHRISEAEQSRAFVRGFQPGLWTRIARRLELKFPDHYPDDPYPLEDIHAAAKFVLAGSPTSHSTSQISQQHSSQQSSSTSVPTISSSAPQIKQEDLSAIFEKFAATLVTAMAGSKANSSPRTSNAPRSDNIDNLVCIFCGHSGHFISECLVCESYINEGKCKKNAEGKVVLPNGQFTPRNIPGRFIKDRIDEWRRRNPDTSVASSLMYGIAPSPVSSPSPGGIYPISVLSHNSEDRIAVLEREIFALRSGKHFNRADQNSPAPPGRNDPTISKNVEQLTPPTATSNAPRAPASTTNGIPSTTADNTSTSTQSSTTTQPPLHPFAGIKENAYLPPHERNFASGPKPRDGPSYHTQAPIQNERIAQDIFDRTMKTPLVTLTSEELLSLSPEVRTKWREQITPKRVQQPPQPSTKLYEDGSIVVPDPYETYINSLEPGQIAQPYVVAKESHSIRSVYMNVNDHSNIESVVDPGSSIVAMSENVCHELGLAYDPQIRLPMQSANGGIDETLGLARNVPCDLGSIILYMQFHIVRDPAYDILLGRPFDVLTESVVRNYRNEAQTITIRDPNSTRTATIPSIARSNRRRKPVREVFRK